MLPRHFLFFLWLVFLPCAQATEAVHTASDLKLEEHVMTLSTELRCLVCQNQTIADSNAPLAIDLRNQVRDKLREGASDQEIKEYMVARYGDFVLYRPLQKPTTWLLWFGPVILLFAAFAVVLFKYRQRRKLEVQQEASLTPEERARAAQLIADLNKGE